MKIKRIIPIILLSVLIITSCESNIDKMIPESYLAGAVSSVEVTIKPPNSRRPDNTVVACYVPFDIKRDQLKPTLFTVLKSVKKECADCKIISIFLYTDKEMEEARTWVGRMEYKEGKIELFYQIPTDEQINKHSLTAGKLDPALFGKGTEINKLPPLHRIDKATYEKYKPIYLLYRKIEKRETYNGDNSLTYKEVARRLKITTKEAEDIAWFMYLSYNWPRGTEEIELGR